jgi:large subunit ribosomal protein L1
VLNYNILYPVNTAESRRVSMTILEKIKEIKEKSKKRNFLQRYDLIVNLKELDLKKAENKVDEVFPLPKGTGKDSLITLFSDGGQKIEGCKFVKSTEIEELAKNKKDLKKIIENTKFFLAEPKLMPIVGKYLGKYLAPRGLMPKPLIGDIGRMISDSKNGIRVFVDKQPIIHTVVGSESMDEKHVEENVKTFLMFLEKRLPKGKNNIKSAYLKLTMGKPVKIEAW